MRSQTVKQQEKLILLHWQLSWYIKGMMKKSRDEEGNAFQGQVRLSLHLFKQLSVSAWLAVTRLIIYSQEWRGSCRPALIIPLALDRKMHLFSSSQRSIKWGIFFSEVLLEKMECTGGKWMLCFLSLIQAELSTLTECVPSCRVKNSLYLHFGSLSGRAHSH